MFKNYAEFQKYFFEISYSFLKITSNFLQNYIKILPEVSRTTFLNF